VRRKAIGMCVSMILVTLGLLVPPVGRADAETVLEKISRTGKLTTGTRTTSIPFAYVNETRQVLRHNHHRPADW